MFEGSTGSVVPYLHSDLYSLNDCLISCQLTEGMMKENERECGMN